MHVVVSSVACGQTARVVVVVAVVVGIRIEHHIRSAHVDGFVGRVSHAVLELLLLSLIFLVTYVERMVHCRPTRQMILHCLAVHRSGAYYLIFYKFYFYMLHSSTFKLFLLTPPLLLLTLLSPHSFLLFRSSFACSPLSLTKSRVPASLLSSHCLFRKISALANVWCPRTLSPSNSA